MKLVKYFDIHDKEVTPVVYTLCFAFSDHKGNDMVHKFLTEDWYHDTKDENWIPLDNITYKYYDEMYQERLNRGAANCYYDNKAMEEFCKNPPSIEEAMDQCWTWLKAHGITQDDEFFLVNIWW